MTEESAFHNLVACYFHEDWDIEGPTVEAVIDTYLRGASPEEVQEALSEIELLLTQPEADVAERLDNWYLAYDYTVDRMDAHDWLRRVEAQLRQAGPGGGA